MSVSKLNDTLQYTSMSCYTTATTASYTIQWAFKVFPKMKGPQKAKKIHIRYSFFWAQKSVNIPPPHIVSPSFLPCRIKILCYIFEQCLLVSLTHTKYYIQHLLPIAISLYMKNEIFDENIMLKHFAKKILPCASCESSLSDRYERATDVCTDRLYFVDAMFGTHSSICNVTRRHRYSPHS